MPTAYKIGKNSEQRAKTERYCPEFLTKTKTMQTVTFDGLKIQKVNEEVYYVTLGDLVVYIDNSTGENYVTKWIEDRMLLTAEHIQ